MQTKKTTEISRRQFFEIHSALLDDIRPVIINSGRNERELEVGVRSIWESLPEAYRKQIQVLSVIETKRKGGVSFASNLATWNERGFFSKKLGKEDGANTFSTVEGITRTGRRQDCWEFAERIGPWELTLIADISSSNLLRKR